MYVSCVFVCLCTLEISNCIGILFRGDGEDNVFFLLLQAEPLMPLLFQVSGVPMGNPISGSKDRIPGYGELGKTLRTEGDTQCGGDCLWRTLGLHENAVGSWMPGKE